MDPNKNPEKIPLNPIQREVRPGLYSPVEHLEKASEYQRVTRTKVIIRRFIDVATGKTILTKRQKYLLRLLLAGMLLVALAVGFWLFWVVAGIRGIF